MYILPSIYMYIGVHVCLYACMKDCMHACMYVTQVIVHARLVTSECLTHAARAAAEARAAGVEHPVTDSNRQDAPQVWNSPPPPPPSASAADSVHRVWLRFAAWDEPIAVTRARLAGTRWEWSSRGPPRPRRAPRLN